MKKMKMKMKMNENNDLINVLPPFHHTEHQSESYYTISLLLFFYSSLFLIISSRFSTFSFYLGSNNCLH